eukprot:TRINITY_DN27119_c0_g1_i1.p1 TRINITY_DN27119_c0_g1~~TRINITY_DN27119_c0_g1_i1.p1  ORF type:complete len:630 (+),score=159.29 TRINITY_DN27119_c0_g1_i1:106-1995(+)
MGGDESYAPPGQLGMLTFSKATHRFCRSSRRGLAVCSWCNKVIWCFGGRCLECAVCGTTLHMKCEAQYHAGEDDAKKTCKEATVEGARPCIRFKAREDAKGDVLVEFDPNPAVPVMKVYSGRKKMDIVPCKIIFPEKPPNGHRRLDLRISHGSMKLLFATRRERELCAACIAHLSQRVMQQISSLPLRIFVGSWNMGDAPPPPTGLTEWVHPEENCDIYALAAQEAPYDSDTQRAIEAAIGSGYYCVQRQSLGSIHIWVYAKAELREAITNVQSTREATGVAGVGANKGGVCVAFSVRETRLCFIGCHLAAHQGKIEARNSDHSEIIEGCSSKIGWKDFWLNNQFHHMYWTGDLNYRIDYTRSKVVQLCYRGPEGWHQLYRYDQLQQQLNNENSFLDFVESQPVFQPTYRMSRKENVYPDDEKQRIPSWCDRVLYKSLSEEVVSQDEYESAMNLLGSDHRPVYSVFTVRARNQYIPSSVLSALTAQPGRNAADTHDCETTAHFVIRHLAGHDLEAADPNGLSDPYIKFFSPVLQNTYQIEKRLKTLNPTWSNEDVPFLYCNFDDRAYLENEYLFFCVYDWDLTSGNDRLGQGSLGLRGLCDGREHNFCVRTLSRGKNAGIITGTIQYSP